MAARPSTLGDRKSGGCCLLWRPLFAPLSAQDRILLSQEINEGLRNLTACLAISTFGGTHYVLPQLCAPTRRYGPAGQESGHYFARKAEFPS